MYKGVFGVAWMTVIAGCSTDRTVDLSAAGRVHVANQGSGMVDVAPPLVVAERSSLVVSGTVTRHPGFDGPVPGRLDVTVIDADGKTVLQQFSTGWDPPHIPVTGDRRATYTVRYGWLPPEGVTVRVDHEPYPDGPGNANGPAAQYRPRYRGTDGRPQLLDGLGGDRSWNYSHPQVVNDARQR